MPNDDLLPDWLRVDSLLPTLNEFKEQTKATSILKMHRAAIVTVDEALAGFWAAFSRCTGRPPIDRTATTAAHQDDQAPLATPPPAPAPATPPLIDIDLDDL